MNRFAAPIRMSLAAGLFALAGPGMLANENEGDAIQQARQEFATIKDTVKPISGGDARKTWPRIDGSNTPLFDVDLVPAPSSRDERKATRSQNWLVEAMMKTAPKETGKGRDDLLADEDDGLEPMERLLVEQLRRDDHEETADTIRDMRVQDELKNAVVNPLDDFMAAWISPRDHSLLLSNRGTGSVGSAVADIRQTVPVSPNGGLGFDSFAWVGAASPKVENPYLHPVEAGFFRPETSAAVERHRGFQPQAQPATTLPLLSEPRTEKSRDRDSLPPIVTKPEEDARYFPQLKRF